MARKIATQQHGVLERPRGWGGYRRLGETTYELYFQASGVRTVEYVSSEGAAILRLDEVLALKHAGRHQQVGGYPFARLAADWLQEKAKPKHDVRASTLRDYEGIIHNHLLPVFGDAYVHELVADALNAYVDIKSLPAHGRPAAPPPPVAGQAKAQVKAQTLNNQLDVLGQVLEHAASRGLIDRNPMTDVIRPKVRREHVNAYETPDALEIISYIDDPDARMVGELLLFLGLRFGEALALYVSDFRLIGQGHAAVRIQRVLRRAGRREPDVIQPGGKTDNAERLLVLSPDFWSRIAGYVAATAERPDRSGEGLLFRTSIGRPVSQSNFRNRHWLPAVGSFTVKRLSPVKLDRLLAVIAPEHRLPVQLLAALAQSTLREVRCLPRAAFDAAHGTLTFDDCRGNRRTQRLSMELADAVARHLSASSANPNARQLMFAGRKGQPIGREPFVADVFRAGFANAEINPMTRVHNLRHTWITTQIENGADDLALAYRAGHHDAGFSRRQYGHARERLRLQVADTYAQAGADPAAQPAGWPRG